jgi:hypothetical protein
MRKIRHLLFGLASAATLLAAGGLAHAQAPTDLRFHVDEARDPADGVQFAVSYGDGHHMTSNTRPIAELAGLTRAQLEAGGPVRFRVARDAGDLDCDGAASHGQAVGACSFVEKPGFARLLQQRGAGAPSGDQMFRLALHDVGTAYLDELKRQHYATASVDDLVRAGEHGVRLSWLQEMDASGYRAGRLPDVIAARDHGVGPRQVAELKAAGLSGMPLDQLVRLRDHGVSGRYLEALAAAGYRGLPAETLIRMRDHGVSAEFVQGLAQAGYAHLEPDTLIRMRDRGISPSFAQRVVADGRKPDPDELIRLRDEGYRSRPERPERGQ